MKVIILSSTTGGGHNSAAKALTKCFETLNIKVKNIDSLEIAGTTACKAISKSYDDIVRKNPHLFGLLYKAGAKISNANKKSIIYKLNSLYSEKLYSLLKKENADIILCTHIFCAETLSSLQIKHSMPCITGVVITDYTCAPFWEETSLDYYFIPHKDLIDEFCTKNMDSTKILPFGLPVDPIFNSHKDKTKAKENLNYSVNKPHIIVMGGSMGAGNIYETTYEIMNALKDIQITVICGNNDKLYNRFKYSNLSNNITVLGYTNEINELMDSADILITKPGGLTSTEAMVKGIPLILINPIPGVETANCSFFTERNMAYFSSSYGETVNLCKLLINNPMECEKMIYSQKQNISPCGGNSIAKFLVEKAHKKEQKE